MDPKTPTTYRGLPPSLRTPSFGNPASPHRYSPGSSLHGGQHEDPLILEIGSRLLRAGFTNEPTPRCQLAWCSALWRRVGDRVSSHNPAVGKRKGGRSVWDLGFALRGQEVEEEVRAQLGLVEDLVERGLRVAYNKHLLIDSKTRKILLPAPPLFPTKLLTTILATLFTHFQCPSVTLMSSPVLAVVASGLRSGLVVDIGWEETIITPVYELRAIDGRGIGVHGRSRRAIKVLREKWSTFLTSFLAAQDDDLEPDLDEVEEIMERVGHVSPASGSLGDDPVLTIPLSGHKLHIPFSSLSIPAEKAFFAPTTAPSDTPAFADDDDTPLPMLLYNVLLRNAIDVRATCVSRIMFVGGGAKIPGLQTRVLAELEGIVKERGWILGRINMDSNGTATNNGTTVEAENENRLEDVEEERENLDPHHYQHHEDKENHRGRSEKPHEKIEGEIRAVKSLGVWCGGSLVAGLKVRGKVEVERERFLSQISMGGSGLPSGW